MSNLSHVNGSKKEVNAIVSLLNELSSTAVIISNFQKTFLLLELSEHPFKVFVFGKVHLNNKFLFEVLSLSMLSIFMMVQFDKESQGTHVDL